MAQLLQLAHWEEYRLEEMRMDPPTHLKKTLEWIKTVHPQQDDPEKCQPRQGRDCIYVKASHEQWIPFHVFAQVHFPFVSSNHQRWLVFICPTAKLSSSSILFHPLLCF